MREHYKVILTAGSLYRELKLEEQEELKIGNQEDCDVILRNSDHQQPYSITLHIEEWEEQKYWNLDCDGTVYISAEGILKQYTRKLCHGDDFRIKYSNGGTEVLRFRFLIDFDWNNHDYQKVIDLHNVKNSMITFGGEESNDIYIEDSLMVDSEFCIEEKDNQFFVDHIRCKYGLYLNGNLIKSRTIIQDWDFISVLGYSFYYKAQTLRTTKDDAIKVRTLPTHLEQVSEENKKYPMFYRNTRVLRQIEEEKITILVPPPEMKKPEGNIIKSLLPMLATLALTIVLRGVIGGGGVFIIFSICTMSMGIASTIASFIGGNREYKRSRKEREEKYKKYISEKKLEIEKKRKEEKAYLERLYVNGQQEYQMVMDFSSDLFHCQKDDIDFLNLYLGKGDLISKQQIDYKQQEQLEITDELSYIPERIAEEYRSVTDVPVTCDLKIVNAIGVVADNFHIGELVKNWITDICTRHYYTDVKVILIGNEEQSGWLFWARFLPHVNDGRIRLIVCDDESKKNIFEYMYKILSSREDGKFCLPEYVVFVLDDMGIKTHPVSRYIQNAGNYGFTFLFFDGQEDKLPLGCNQIIRMSDGKREGTIIDAKDEGNSRKFCYNLLGGKQAYDIAMKLAPVYTEEVSLENSLVKNITLFELLNINNVRKLELEKRWNSSQVEKTLAAPLGVNSKGEIVYLDLHEKAHGPHGLVAGTTGSGKSEILQSYVLSMATLYHPYEVSFMIIDFKGGGMVNQFRNLPHLIGAITNIDGKAIERSLKSIKAELKKRQRCFAEAGVNRIDAYIQKQKQGEVTEILPHLIVIVDEFAELKAEQPEFMKELISAARIGRSLGVHLILATQKPAGQVNEQIWSNSKFKLCLKVQNKEDSNEVLKSPLAAEIREPGRAYLQVGNNEIFELFQSAYSGGPADKSEDSERKPFQITRIEKNGSRTVIYKYESEKQEKEAVTELDAIVEHIAKYCEKKGIKKVPDICMPPLPEQISFQEIKEAEAKMNVASPFQVPIGIYDDPDNQYQGNVSIDVMNANTIIIGSSQTGKTNLLELLILYFSSQYSPDEFTFYVLDFGTRVLNNFAKMKHCGGVVCSGEDEKYSSLMRFLHKEMEIRKEKLLNTGVTSYSSYIESGRHDIPLIMLFIDNFTALKELYLNAKDELLDICRDGISLGITVTIANAVTNGIGFRYMSNFGNKLAFTCNDSGEYTSLFESCRLRPEAIPGRCLIEISKVKYECQTYLAFEGEKEIERVTNMRTFIDEVNSHYSQRAKQIPVIPMLLKQKELFTMCSELPSGRYPFGLDCEEIVPMFLDLSQEYLLTLSGRDHAGKTMFIKCFLSYLEQCNNGGNADNAFDYQVYISDGIQGKLKSVKDYRITATYNTNPECAVDMVHTVHEKLKERYNRMLLFGDMESVLGNRLILILNSKESMDVISKDKEALQKFNEIVDKYKNLGVFVIFGRVPNAQILYSSPALLQSIKQNKHYMVFEDANLIKVTDISSAIQLRYKKPIEPGEGYYIKNTMVKKVKTPII